MTSATTNFSWSTDSTKISELATFFIENVEPSYISHGEVHYGRATDLQTWSPELRAILEEGFEYAMSAEGGGESCFSLATAECDGVTIGLAIVEFKHDTRVAILQDLVIAQSYRAKKIGAKFLLWIEDEARKKDMKSLFLESGIKNRRAHHFFEHNGFTVCSVEMVKEL